jgi:SulP family sulfate permease
MTLASLRTYVRHEWFGNIRGDLLSGLVVALALIPEAIAFSIIAGVDPKVGLYASFSIAVLIAFFGGRPGMISAATAATAVLMVTLVRDHGLQYLLAATFLAGILQILCGLFRLDRLMRFVSRSVLTGFVNALAILIFMAQLPELIGVPWLTYVMLAAGLAIIYGVPRLTRAIPSPLICIVVLTAASLALGLDLRTVADMGQLPTSWPSFLLPDVPFTLETVWIVLPYSAGICAVGLLESLMTAQVVDELTDTTSNKRMECVGQGIANAATCFIGGMAGCAMIGQSGINVISGGRGRLSCFAAGVLLLIFCVALGEWVGRIPMAALVAVMVMVSVSTFRWGSLLAIRTQPASSSVVMATTVVVVVATKNLALGVLAGALLSGLFFAWKVARQVRITSTLNGATRTYEVEGQIFFASAEDVIAGFNYREPLDRVVIDATGAHVWDLTGVAALDTVVTRLRRSARTVELVGLNPESQGLVTRLSTLANPSPAGH